MAKLRFFGVYESYFIQNDLVPAWESSKVSCKIGPKRPLYSDNGKLLWTEYCNKLSGVIVAEDSEPKVYVTKGLSRYPNVFHL